MWRYSLASQNLVENSSQLFEMMRFSLLAKRNLRVISLSYRLGDSILCVFKHVNGVTGTIWETNYGRGWDEVNKNYNKYVFL